jgi:curli biogenesis system outer membrane secretion channel CsgG
MMGMFLENRCVGLGLTLLMMVSLGLTTTAIAVEPPQDMQVAQAQPTKKKRIAVLDFDAGSTGGTFAAGFQGIGAAKGVGDLIVNKLVEDGTYRVIERSKVDQLLKEQDLGSSGRVEAGTAAEIGRLLGVEVVLVGTITQFNVDSKKSGFSAGGLFSNSKKTTTATVQLTGRLVDTKTGEIVAIGKGEGEANQKDTSQAVLGFGGGSETNNVETLLSTAADKAVTQMVSTITGSTAKLPTSQEAALSAEALIADVTGGQVTINKGSEEGFSKGMQLSVERVTKQVKDPSTGRVLRSISTAVGKIELIEVSQGYATGKVLSGSGFKVGDTVKTSQ